MFLQKLLTSNTEFYDKIRTKNGGIHFYIQNKLYRKQL